MPMDSQADAENMCSNLRIVVLDDAFPGLHPAWVFPRLTQRANPWARCPREETAIPLVETEPLRIQIIISFTDRQTAAATEQQL